MDNKGRIEFEPKLIKLAALALGFTAVAFLAMAAVFLSDLLFAFIIALLGAIGLFVAYRKKFPGVVFDFGNMQIERGFGLAPNPNEIIRMQDVLAVSYGANMGNRRRAKLPVVKIKMKNGEEKNWNSHDDAMAFYLKEMCERCGVAFNMEGVEPYMAGNGFAYADNYKAALGMVVFCAVVAICALIAFQGNFLVFLITGVPFVLGMLIIGIFSNFYEIRADSTMGNPKISIVERKGIRLFIPRKLEFGGNEIECIYMRLNKGLVHFGIKAAGIGKFDIKSEDLNTHTDFKRIANALRVKFLVEGVD